MALFILIYCRKVKSLQDKRRSTFYSDFDKIFTELHQTFNSRDVREVYLITGATVLNPRETWKVSLPPKKFGLQDASNPNVSFLVFFLANLAFQLVCLGKLLMSEFFDTKRPSGNLHIIIGTFL